MDEPSGKVESAWRFLITQLETGTLSCVANMPKKKNGSIFFLSMKNIFFHIVSKEPTLVCDCIADLPPPQKKEMLLSHKKKERSEEIDQSNTFCGVMASPTLPPPNKSEMLLSRRKKERSEEIDVSDLFRQNQDLIAENSMMKRYLNSILMPREYHWVIEDFTWSTRLYVSEVFCYAGTITTSFLRYPYALSHNHISSGIFHDIPRPMLDVLVWIQRPGGVRLHPHPVKTHGKNRRRERFSDQSYLPNASSLREILREIEARTDGIQR